MPDGSCIPCSACDMILKGARMFDIDGNGSVDPGEEYLAFRIWEEMTGIQEEEEQPDIPEEDDE